MKILADAHIPYLKGVAEQFGDVTYLPGIDFTKEVVKDKDVLIVRTVTHFDGEILDNSKVKLICSATIGFDHIDIDYCNTHNIAWRTAPGCNAQSVEQYVTASLLTMSQKQKFRLQDKVIGIVGVGNVGREVARACRALGMKVLLNDPPLQEKKALANLVSLSTIEQEADIITFHTPLTRSGSHPTYHLANDDFFERLDKKPIIINSSRGAVVDNRALIAAIDTKKISGTVIDTWENEPNINEELLHKVDIATPHIAGYSADGKWNATRISLENINNFFHLQRESINLHSIPQPEKSVIDLINCTADKQIETAILHTYNPVSDSDALKRDPAKFSYFRSHYPIRREYKAYRLLNLGAKNEQIAKVLGFNIE